MICSACGSDNETGRKFCKECGTALVLLCGSCSAPNAPDSKFCGECGRPLAAASTADTTTVPPTPSTPTTERRLVSVLFADLVGFTALSEHRDAEDVRELLSRYFDAARDIVERHGGLVEKFIGDAVMAVWERRRLTRMTPSALCARRSSSSKALRRSGGRSASSCAREGGY